MAEETRTDREQPKKEKIETFRAVVNPSKEYPLWNLIAMVGSKKCTFQQASQELRNYIKSLNEEEFAAWKANAIQDARMVMSIGEAFSQELTVIAAGQ